MYFFTLFTITLIVYKSQCSNYQNVDYCQIACLNNGAVKHVICEREEDNCGPHKRCENFAQVNMTRRLQQVILNEHNIYRSKVALGIEKRGNYGPQPSASNMNTLRYSEELENIAQCWANTCQMEKHSGCNRGIYLPYVGQNMALRSYSWREGLANVEKQVKLMTASWYDEVTLFNRDIVPRFAFDLGYGHYTQMIWGTAEEVGCGLSMYTRDGWYNILYVCNYGSQKISGNVLNFEVYKTGKPCSKCPTGKICDPYYGGLCRNVDGNNVIENNRNSKAQEDTNTSPFYNYASNIHANLILILSVALFCVTSRNVF